jgi:hypothetical protein
VSVLELNVRSCGDAPALVRKARELARSSNRLATEFLVEHIGVRVTHTRNEAYFGEALNYLCAQLCARAQMPKQAAEYMAASHILPGSGGDALFHDAIVNGITLAHAQDEAIAREMPALMLACMPRAASAALTQTLAKITGAPLFRVSLGQFPNCGLVPVWLQRFLQGGAVLHDHFGASDFNIGVLRDFGLNQINLLVRDPRPAAASYARWGWGARATEGDVYSAYTKSYLPWMQGWLDAESSGHLSVRWIASTDVTSGPDRLRTVLSSIFDTAGPRAAVPLDGVELVHANFSGEDPDAWRRWISCDLQKQMWALIPAEIVARLGLIP